MNTDQRGIVWSAGGGLAGALIGFGVFPESGWVWSFVVIGVSVGLLANRFFSPGDDDE